MKNEIIIGMLIFSSTVCTGSSAIIVILSFLFMKSFFLIRVSAIRHGFLHIIPFCISTRQRG